MADNLPQLKPIWCFRGRAWIWVAAASLLLGMLFPVLGAGSYVVAAAGTALCYALKYLSYPLPIVVGLMGIPVAKRLSKNANEKDRQGAQGCGCILGGILGIVLLSVVQGTEVPAALDHAASACWRLGPAGWKFFLTGRQTQTYLLAIVPGTLAGLFAAGSWGLLLTLRGMQSLRKTYRGISYTCPDCHRRSLPRFLCPNCSTRIPDLMPSRYGLFYARCAKCGFSDLPTLDFLGRAEMDAVCESCNHPLEQTNTGEYHLAIVGPARSGKTNFLFAAVDRFKEEFCAGNDVDFRFISAAEEETFNSRTDAMRSGESLAKTDASRAPIAMNFVINTGAQDALIYLYDPAGELVENYAAMGRLDFVHHVDGVFFVVDLASIPKLRYSQDSSQVEAVAKARGAVIEADLVASHLIAQLEDLFRVQPGERIPIPLAVVATKADILGPQAQLGGSNDASGQYDCFFDAAVAAHQNSKRVCNALQDWGLANLTDMIENHFAMVSYFSCSALGRNADDPRPAQYQPVRVAAPLVWLLHASRVLDDEDLGPCKFFFRYVNHILRGEEGLKLQLISWTVLILSIVLVITLFFSGLWLAFAS